MTSSPLLNKRQLALSFDPQHRKQNYFAVITSERGRKGLGELTYEIL